MDPRERLAAYRSERDLASVWLCRPASVAWIADGADVVVDRSAGVGVAAVGLDADGLTALAPTNEADRLAAEELPDLPVESFPWYRGTVRDAVRERAARPAAADVDLEGIAGLDPSALRLPLHARAIERYRALGRATARAVETVARDAGPDDTEREVAGRLAGRLEARGITATVVLVGGGDRAPAYRHPIPTDASLGAYAVLSVTARRDGLHASCTRTVAFDPPDWLGPRHAAACRIETAAIAATREAGRSDGTSGDVFERIEAAYTAAGWPEEWRRHHQGGATGYAGREWVALPGGDRPVDLPTAFAYNPTVEGAKSEDTVVVSDTDIEVLTRTGAWPTRTVEVDGLRLERPAIRGL